MHRFFILLFIYRLKDVFGWYDYFFLIKFLHSLYDIVSIITIIIIIIIIINFSLLTSHVSESRIVLNSGFLAVDSGFQVLDSRSFSGAHGFRIPKPNIPDSTSKNFPDSGIRIQLYGAILCNKASLYRKSELWQLDFI